MQLLLCYLPFFVCLGWDIVERVYRILSDLVISVGGFHGSRFFPRVQITHLFEVYAQEDRVIFCKAAYGRSPGCN
jgi:hypothetical protein